MITLPSRQFRCALVDSGRGLSGRRRHIFVLRIHLGLAGLRQFGYFFLARSRRRG
jgi:hypothetical protein